MTDSRGAIILEGTAKYLHSHGVRREAVQGALINASIVLGLSSVLRSFDPQETARLMVYACRQVSRFLSGGIYRHGRRPKGRRRQQLFILQGLPRIGPERAEQLLISFGGVEAVFSAPYDELIQVPGIGRKTAEDIRSMVQEGSPVYNLPMKYTLSESEADANV